MRAQRLTVLAGALTLLAAAASPSQAHVYWSDYATQGISRAALDGTGATPLFVASLDANSPDGLASDGTHLSWSTASGTGTYGTLGRVTLAVGLVEPAWLMPSGGVGRGMALDATHVWWVRGSGGGSDGSIARAEIDGSAPNVAFVGAAAFPTGVARDGVWVYWTESVSLRLGRARASDGGDVVQTAMTGIDAPTGIAARDGWVYWSNAGTNTIGRVRADGASPNAFSQADPSFITGAATPLAVATDSTYLYWANGANGTIGRAKLDGTAVEQSFITGAGQPAPRSFRAAPKGASLAKA